MKLHRLFLILTFCGLMVFVINSSAFSARKPLWLDEIYSYRQIISRYSYSHLLFSGATSEGSPAPLDYLIIKWLYNQRRNLSYLHLSPFQYFRLQNLIYLSLGWAYIVYLLGRYSRSGVVSIAYWIILLGFLFNHQIAYFASESRPYFLWATLSLICLYQLRFNPFRPHWPVTVFLLSLASTAGIYQIVTILMVGIFIRFFFSVRLPFWWLAWPVVTAAVCLYYISQVGYPGYPPPDWRLFWLFYRDYLPFIFLGVWACLSEKNRSSVGIQISSLVAAGWLALGPLSFLMTKFKGFFFDPRQYIYYLPAVLIILANSIFSFRRFKLLPFILIAWGGLFLLRQTSLGIGLAARLMYYGQPVSIPVNFTLISDRIPRRIPDRFDFISNPAQSDSLNNQALENVNFWWDYLSDTYPKALYSRDAAAVLVIRARDLNSELVKVAYD